MAQSNSMWGAKKAIFTASDLLASESGSGSVLISCFGVSLHRSRPSSFVLLFSHFSRNVFFRARPAFSPPLRHPAQVCLSRPPASRLSLSFPASGGFVICRSASVHLHPLPIIISHLIYFSALPPQRSASVILPLRPQRVPLCICMIFKTGEMVEPQ